MNLVNRFFLWLALRPLLLYTKAGVDPAQLKAILSTKLLMDDRRPAAWRQYRRQTTKPANFTTVITMFWCAVLGLLYLLSFTVSEDLVTQLTLFFSLFFIMLSLTLIADFTAVLIDVRDNFIILPKPVTDRTVVVARLLHIFIHLSKLVLPMALPAAVYMASTYGAYALLLLLLLVLLLSAFSIFFINALYLAILRFTTPHRFRAIIGGVQIVMTVVVYASYQIVPRLLRTARMDEFVVDTVPGIGLYPLYWLAKAWWVLYRLGGTLADAGYALAGLLFPVICAWLVVRYLAPTFNRKVSLIAASGEGGAPTKKTAPGRRSRGIWRRLLTRTHAERAGFDLTWKMTARSRDFTMRVYPAIGYLLVYAVIVALNTSKPDSPDFLRGVLGNRASVVTILYFTSVLLISAAAQVAYSEKYKAAWPYFVAPLAEPGAVLVGATKAIIVKFYLPMVLVVSAFILVVNGPAVLPNLLLGMSNQVLIAGLRVLISYRSFPFSLHQGNQENSGSFLRSIGVFFVTSMVGLAHYFLYNVLPAVLLCAVLSAVASWLVFDSLKRTSWAQIHSRYEES